VIRWGRVRVVAAKELRDTLRDRRTLLMMVLVPALLYPLGGVALSQLTVSAMARLDREGYSIAIEGAGEGEIGGPAAAVVRAALGRDQALAPRPVKDVEEALRAKADPAALGLRVRRVAVPLPGAAPTEQVQVELLYDAASARSRAGLDRARKALDAEAEARRKARLDALHLSEAALTPLSIKERSISSEGKAALVHLAPAVAILLILLSLMGAFYPAIDLIAGERERGTFEPLLCTPTSRLEIVAGKYACLAVLALSTCVLNLAALSLTTGFMLRAAGPALALGPAQALLLLLATAPVLLLVSALLLLAAVFARSFKDAQNLMTPVYLLCIVPALCGLVPGMRLQGGLALVPVLSAVLFIKELLGGTLQLLPGFISVTAGLVYAAVAVALAARVFESAEVGGARVADHGLSLLTAPAEPGTPGPPGPPGRVLTLTGALGVYGLCLALMLHAAPRLQLWSLRGGLLLTELGLVLAPVLLGLRLGGVPLRAGLGLAPISARQAAGALLFGVGGAALGLWLFVFVTDPLLRPPPEYLQALEALKPKGALDTALMVGLGALLPALCEEALCRGLLLQAARRTLGPPAAVLLAGFLFAVLHVDPYRFLGTLVLGCLLGLAAWRAGSLYAACLMHLGNNALAFLAGGWLEGPLSRPGPALHAGLLSAAVLGLGLGFLLLRPPPRP
jgi:sodium transport system permease protein